jgi:hypothetical protein
VVNPLYTITIERSDTMAKRPRRNHGAVFKAKVALEASKGDLILVELSETLPGASQPNSGM